MSDRLLARLALAAAALGVLAWAAAFVVDAALGLDVVLVVPHDPADLDVHRALWRADGSPRTPRDVASAHGRVVDEVRAVVPADDRVVRPPEDPSVALYPVALDGDRPVQVRTVHAVARTAAAVLGALSLAALVLRRRRSSAGARRHPEAPA